MINKYIRYFKITEGPLIEAVKECKATNKKAKEEYKKILKKIGADEGYYVCGHSLVAVTFENAPDTKVYKRSQNTKDGWYPKKNCKAGREIAQALEAIKTKNLYDCLKAVDLYSGPVSFPDASTHFAGLTIIPSDPLTALVTVPWYDEDLEVLEQYKKDREAGTHRCMSLDALLWEPTPEMTEIKGWEYMKAIQEWNDSLGIEEKYA